MPNLICYFNYEDSPNLGYYWIDYITGSNLYANPESPIREGFTFTGWFLDESCQTEWDDVLPASIEENLELFAGWQEK